jgi:cysteine desulfurase
LVHCDAVQAVGRIPVDVYALDVDLLSLSGHKLYGPKGVAALYIRGGRGALPIKPLMFGGGQEDGLRPGTLNVPLIVGFGAASGLASTELSQEAARLHRLRDDLEGRLMEAVPSVHINGDLGARLPGNSSITFPGIDAEALLANLPDVSVSTGSACNAGALEPSYVLTAIGLTWELAYQTIRIGLGRYTSEQDCLAAAEAITGAAKRLAADLGTRLGG